MAGPPKESERAGSPDDDYDEDQATEIGRPGMHPFRKPAPEPDDTVSAPHRPDAGPTAPPNAGPTAPPYSGPTAPPPTGQPTTRPSGNMSTRPPPLPMRASVRPIKAATTARPATLASNVNLQPPRVPFPSDVERTFVEPGEDIPTIAGVRGSKTNLPTARPVGGSPTPSQQPYAPAAPQYEEEGDDTTTARRNPLADPDEDQTTRVDASEIKALLGEDAPLSSVAASFTGTTPMEARPMMLPESQNRAPVAGVAHNPYAPTPNVNTMPVAHLPPRPEPMFPISPKPLYMPPSSAMQPSYPSSQPGPPMPSGPMQPLHPSSAGQLANNTPSKTPLQTPGAMRGAAMVPPQYLSSVPGIPVIPPLLPNGEAIPLEPARFDGPSLAALRGDAKLPFLGPQSTNELSGAGPVPAESQRKWVIIAVSVMAVALCVAAAVLWFVFVR